MQFSDRVRYGVLYSNLAQDDAAQIVAELKSGRSHYRLSAGGTIIEVPVGQRRRAAAGARRRGAAAGRRRRVRDLRQAGVRPVATSSRASTTSARSRRELARTIESLDSVDLGARAPGAAAEEALFAEEKRQPSASVVVRLRPGRVVERDRIRAIAQPGRQRRRGADPRERQRDRRRRAACSPAATTRPSQPSASQHEAKRMQEQNIESTLVSLLEPIVGAGRVRARATVELNMTRVDRIEESYDPDGAVLRSEQKTKSSRGGGTRAGGVAGHRGQPARRSRPAGAAGSDDADAVVDDQLRDQQDRLDDLRADRTPGASVGGGGRRPCAQRDDGGGRHRLRRRPPAHARGDAPDRRTWCARRSASTPAATTR